MKSMGTKERLNKKNKRLAIILGLMACSFYGVFVLIFAING
jgi:hypothetical protein